MKTVTLSNSHEVAFIDDEDEARCAGISWWLTDHGYAKGAHHQYLHHFVKGHPSEGLVCDHKDQCKLNCQKENLHFVTHAQNHANGKCHLDPNCNIEQTTGGGYLVRFRVPGKRIFVGRFTTIEEARLQRDLAKSKYQASVTKSQLFVDEPSPADVRDK